MYGGAGSCSSAALKMSWCSNTEFTFLALVHSAPPIQTAIQAHLHAAIIFPLLWGKTPHTLLPSLAADKLLCKLQMINQETGLTGKKSEELAQSSQQHATSWVCCRRCQTRALRPKCLLHRSRRYMLETFFTSMNEQTCELFVTKRCKKKKKKSWPSTYHGSCTLTAEPPRAAERPSPLATCLPRCRHTWFQLEPCTYKHLATAAHWSGSAALTASQDRHKLLMNDIQRRVQLWQHSLHWWCLEAPRSS